MYLLVLRVPAMCKIGILLTENRYVRTIAFFFYTAKPFRRRTHYGDIIMYTTLRIYFINVCRSCYFV